LPLTAKRKLNNQDCGRGASVTRLGKPVVASTRKETGQNIVDDTTSRPEAARVNVTCSSGF